jgi:hypothetical protein
MILGYAVLAAVTLLAAFAWVIRLRKPASARRWSWLATAAALDAWIWWLATGSPFAPLWVLIWPLVLINFVLAWAVISDLTGVQLQGARSARLDGNTIGLDDEDQ